MATLVWGGYYSTLISVGSNTERTKRLIADSLVEVLVPVVDDALVLEALAEHPYLTWPGADFGYDPPFLSDDGKTPAVDVRLVMSHLYRSYFQAAPPDAPSPWFCPTWKVGHDLAPYFTVLFGDYGRASSTSSYLNWYVQGLRATSVDLATTTAPPRSLYTPLGLTRLAVEPRTVPTWRGVVVGNPKSFDDLVNYWNLRSTGVSGLFWPLGDDTESTRQAIGEALVEDPKTQAQSEPGQDRIFVCGSEDEISVPPALQAALGDEALVLRLDARSWVEFQTPPESISASSSPQLAVLEIEDSRATLITGAPPNPFSAAQGSFPGDWLIQVESHTVVPNFTFRLPHLPDLTKWASWEMTDGFGGVRIGTSSISVLANPGAPSLRLRLPHQADVFAQLFERAHITISERAAGKATTEIIRLFGGLRECRLFRLPGVREVLGSDSWRSWQGCKQLVAAGGLSDYPGATADSVLEHLANQSAMHAGLRIQCPNCSIRYCYEPRVLGDTLRCPRCREEFPVTPFLHDSTWMFRASGFFADRGGHGAIPVLLTMMRLEQQRGLQFDRFLASSHELRSTDRQCESDLLALEMHPDGRCSVAVAECKTHMEIQPQDIDNLRYVADTIRASGLECYVIFATTRDSFSPDELALFRAYRSAASAAPNLDLRGAAPPGRPGPILFTARELDKLEMYGRDTQGKVRHERASTLRELAENSDDLYL